MRMEKLFFVSFTALTLILSQEVVTLARGGGGGFGGGGFHGGGASMGARDGGFGRADYGRGDFDRGDFGRGQGFDHLDNGYYGRGMDDRPDAFSRPYGGWGNSALDGNRGMADRSDLDRQLDNDLSRPDNYVKNWNNNDAGRMSSLPTDGGFGRFLNGGNARNFANLGNRTNAMRPDSLASRGNEVRDNFNNLARNWQQNHPNWWNNWNHPYGWYPDWWVGAGWGGLADFWDYPADDEPVYYDYGNNITYQGDTVYYGSQPLESANNYYQQAETLANSSNDVYYPALQVNTNQQQGNTNNLQNSNLQNSQVAKLPDNFKKNWKPLGVYSLVDGEQADTTQLVQLAVNKSGVVRGNYYNVLTAETKPVKGTVDKKNMRVAWTIGDNKNVVYDTGVSNLLKEQSPILIHFDKAHTEQWTLVKLEQPKDNRPAS